MIWQIPLVMSFPIVCHGRQTTCSAPLPAVLFCLFPFNFMFIVLP